MQELGTTASTGITGLDDILRGGLPRNRVYLVQGSPGVGKTTLGMHFLLEGVRRGEACLYITLSETGEELRAVARAFGWSLDGINIHELGGAEDPAVGSLNTIFHPADVELQETVDKVLGLIERIRPARVVFDSLSELRLLAGDSLRYRRQLLALKQHFAGRGCTVLLLDDGTAAEDKQPQTLAHGVIELESLAPGFGANRRTLQVVKLRGVDFRSGRHDYVIRPTGLVVFPRLVASEHRARFPQEAASTGRTELDQLLGGGLARGTSTLFLGPAGSGKSSVAAQYAYTALQRGEKVAWYTFDEILATMLHRSASMGCDLRGYLDSGALSLRQVDPAELSPGEFAHAVQASVEAAGCRTVVIDSVNGYLMSMPDDRHLIIQMHELLSYLNQLGVVTILIVAQHGLVGQAMNAPVDLTYLADTVMVFRFFEAEGRVLKAVSVLKKRTGAHEDTIREFRVTSSGTRVGEPLVQFRGVLSGLPDYQGTSKNLLGEDSGE